VNPVFAAEPDDAQGLVCITKWKRDLSRPRGTWAATVSLTSRATAQAKEDKFLKGTSIAVRIYH